MRRRQNPQSGQMGWSKRWCAVAAGADMRGARVEVSEIDAVVAAAVVDAGVVAVVAAVDRALLRTGFGRLGVRLWLAKRGGGGMTR